MPNYNYEQAGKRLLLHSPLPKRNNEDFYDSFTFIPDQAERNKEPPSLDSVEDVIECLQVANQEYNGVPASAQNRRNRLVVADLEYAVSGIITRALQCHIQWMRKNLFSADIRDALEHAIYLIAYAWDQLLAGDIDDLVEGADLELDSR